MTFLEVSWVKLQRAEEARPARERKPVDLKAVLEEALDKYVETEGQFPELVLVPEADLECWHALFSESRQLAEKRLGREIDCSVVADPACRKYSVCLCFRD